MFDLGAVCVSAFTADTFRAAAVDQLKIWSERVGCDFYSKGMNTDPAAVAYETVRYAIEQNHDLVIIDLSLIHI